MNLDNPNYSGKHKQNRDFLDFPPTTTLSTFSSNPNQNLTHRISPQFFDQSITNHNRPERPKTLGTGPVRKSVSMESSQYSAIPVGHTRSKQQHSSATDDSNKRTELSEQGNNIVNGSASKQSNSVVLSPFDEQEEWAKISEIMAAFGTDLLVDGSNNGTKPNRTRMRGSISSTKSLGSPMDPPPTPLSLLVDWLYDNELEELERVLVSHGYDDYYFIVSVHSGRSPSDRLNLNHFFFTYRTAYFTMKTLKLSVYRLLIERNYRKQLPRCLVLNRLSKITTRIQILALLNGYMRFDWMNMLMFFGKFSPKLNLRMSSERFRFIFSRHLIMDMDRICRIWEIELQTVIEIHKIGHRKRMLHSVGLPTCKKKDEKKNQILAQDANGDGKSVTNKKDEIISKTLEQNNHTNGNKMNHGKNRLVE